MEAMRESWTDDRLDDLSRHVESGFAQVHEDMAALRVDNKELRRDLAALDRDLRAEIGQLATREELHAELNAVRSEIKSQTSCSLRSELNSQTDSLRSELSSQASSLRLEMREAFDALNHRFDALQRTLIAGVLAGFIGLLVTHFG